MAPICLFPPLLAHIFAFKLKKATTKKSTGKDTRSRREKAPVQLEI